MPLNTFTIGLLIPILSREVNKLLMDAKTRMSIRMMTRANKTSYLFFKRVTDIIVSILLLLFLLPVILLICYSIYRSEGRPVFHRRKCAGIRGKPFIMHTFRKKTNRSQVIRALPPHPYPQSWEEGVPDEFSFRYSPLTTYTSIGLKLERYNIDKIPLLYHVLKGDLSLVGPTPELFEIVMYYNKYQKQRLHAKPGLTGYAKATDKSEQYYHKQIAADIHYIRNRSYIFDLKVLIRSVGLIFLKK